MIYRTRRLTRLVVPLTAAVALSGAAGAALAADISTPATNAGQGVGEVDGFTVSGIGYSTATSGGSDPDATVDQVEFTIERSDQLVAVDDTNAEVWIQLRTDSSNSSWAACTISADDATCDTSSLSVTMASLSEVSIIAYDI